MLISYCFTINNLKLIIDVFGFRVANGGPFLRGSSRSPDAVFSESLPTFISQKAIMENPNYNENDIEIFTEDTQPPPLLYSQNMVRLSSFFFTTLCGGILMFINLKRIGKPKEAGYVLATGIGYLVLWVSIGVITSTRNNSSVSMLSGILGAILIGQFFWDRYIGKNFAYNKRPVWIPLIISLVSLAAILALIFYADSL